MPRLPPEPAPAAPPRTVAIIGAGPAGLTAAYEFVRRGLAPWIFERDVRVGGLAQTVEHRGYRIDIGGHRFTTSVAAIRELWRAMLGDDLLVRTSRARAYYDGRLFEYPWRPLDMLRRLGPRQALSVAASYIGARLFPVRPEVSLADWAGNRFGRRLYRIFIETNARKIWGRSGEDLEAEWAAERVDRPGPADEFEYPRLGPGMMWEAFRRAVESGGGRVRLGTRVSALAHDGTRITALTLERDGDRAHRPVDHVISTMPLADLVHALMPPAPADVRAAADRLQHRDLLTVALIVDRREIFPDQWIAVHDPSVRVARIQNYKNWSPAMVPDETKTSVGLEYFCTAGDDLSSKSDADLIALAIDELTALGFGARAEVADAVVVRTARACALSGDDVIGALATIRAYLDRFSNLQTIGGNGMHRDDSQDRAMLTAMLAVRNYFGERHNLWVEGDGAVFHRFGGFGDRGLPY